MNARDGSAVIICACSNECTVLSRDSRINASDTPPAKPTSSDIIRLRGIFGVEGAVGGEAGSTIRTLLGTQASHDARFLQFLQQAFIKLPIAFHIALQQAVFDGAFVKLVLFVLLIFQRCPQQFLAFQRSLVVLLVLLGHAAVLRS